MSLHPASRGIGLNATTGKSSTSNLNGGGASDVPSPSATILDTLKKKMNLLKVQKFKKLFITENSIKYLK